MNEFGLFEHLLAKYHIVFFLHITIYLLKESTLIVRLTNMKIYANH